MTLTVATAAAVLDGEIDPFIEELATEDEAKRLAEAGFED